MRQPVFIKFQIKADLRTQVLITDYRRFSARITADKGNPCPVRKSFLTGRGHPLEIRGHPRLKKIGLLN